MANYGRCHACGSPARFAWREGVGQEALYRCEDFFAGHRFLPILSPDRCFESDFIACTGQDNWGFRQPWLASELAAKLDAIHSRHRSIRDDERWVQPDGGGKPAMSIIGRLHVKTFEQQDPFPGKQETAIIVHQKNCVHVPFPQVPIIVSPDFAYQLLGKLQRSRPDTDVRPPMLAQHCRALTGTTLGRSLRTTVRGSCRDSCPSAAYGQLAAQEVPLMRRRSIPPMGSRRGTRIRTDDLCLL